MRTTRIQKLIKLIVIKESNREKNISTVCVLLNFFVGEVNFIKMLINFGKDNMFISLNCLFT